MMFKSALSLLQAKLTGKNVPLVVGWAVTNKCNKKCSYCGLWRKNEVELTTEQIFKIIDELAGMGTKVISFTGGEPLLRADISEIIDYTVSKGIKVKLNSNGSLIKDKIYEIKNISVLNLSLDGPEVIHDSIRGEGSYKEVIEAAKTAKANGINVVFSSVLSNKNFECAEFVSQKAKEFNAKVSFQPATENILGSRNDNPDALSCEQFKETLNKLITLKNNSNCISNTVSGLKHLLENTKSIKCAGGHITCRIQPSGDVMHCSRNTVIKPLNAVEHGFKAAFDNLKTVSCANCWCASRIELNLLWTMNIKTIFERLTADKIILNTPVKPVRVLGITDTHGAGAAIIEDGKIIFAIEEERLNRSKGWRGMPVLSIQKCLESAGLKPEDIDLIAIAGRNTPNIFLRARSILKIVMNNKREVFKPESKIRKIYKNFQVFIRNIPFGHIVTELISKILIRKQLSGIFSGNIPKIVLYDHHLIHASAYYLSGFDKALTVTMDNQGDGISTGVFLCDNNEIKLYTYENSINSLGYFYDLITAYLGFNPVTDAGKTIGLAAYGKPEAYEMMKKRISYKNGRIRCRVGLGILSEQVKSFFTQLNKFKNEDIACSAQKLAEEIITSYVSYYVKKTGYKKVVFSGGVGYNIKVNQKIKALGCVDELFVYPICGDNGLSALAGVYAYSNYFRKNMQKERISHVYLGPSYTAKEVENVLGRYSEKLDFRRIENIDQKVADFICEGKTVWRFQGRMEYGPRALGHRSILALPKDRGICETINKKLGREFFMPFCPTLLAEFADEYLSGIKNTSEAPFMIVGYDVKGDKKIRIPAVIHVDDTARPQIIEKNIDRRYWNILNEINKKTGCPVILNTSFNRHGEPIVCSPEDAVKSFIKSSGDLLALEDYIVCIKQKAGVREKEAGIRQEAKI